MLKKVSKMLILQGLICLMLLFSCAALAQEVVASGSCGVNVTWELDSEGVLTISGSGEMADYVSYTSVPWYSPYESINAVVIEDGVTGIGETAFYGCSNLASITIPDSVTSIGVCAFCYCGSLESVTIPEGVRSIEKNTFSSCHSLTSITIPDGVTSIGEGAFDFCTNLASITIPEGVTSIGDYAFDACCSLESITLPDSLTSISNSAFEGCTSLESITIPESVTSIGVYAFYYCSSLRSITIPESVTSIGARAFMNCSSLTRIELPDNITEIGSTVFDGCPAEVVCRANSQTATTLTNAGYTFTPAGPTVVASGSCGANVTWQLDSEGLLTISGSGAMTDYSYDAPWYSRRESINAVVIEEGVTSIGDYAFDDCSDLTSITIPDGVTSIGNAAFDCCVNLASISIPDSVTSIGASAFNGCVSLESIVIPEGVTSIGAGTFSSCCNLTSVTIPDGVTSIGDYAFDTCYSLESITLPDSLTSIGISAFSNCTSLVSVTIPDGVTSIGSVAFAACSNMKQITIPASLTSISISAFAGCRSLESITIPDSVTSIGNSAFYNCSSLTRIELPDNIVSIGSNVFNGCSAEVVCNANTQTAATLTNAGYTFTTLGPAIVASGDCGENVTWALNSEGLLTISGSGAMENYSDGDAPWYSRRESVCAVVIEDGVMSIGDWAFSDCSGLASITIPDSVTSIGMDAFAGCSSLESIVIPAGVTSIGVSAFAGCSSLESITIPDSVTSIGSIAFAYCSSLESITIPESVTSIGARAFMNCSGLKSITIPEGVAIIEGYVFSGCTSLESITIPESVTSIGGRAFMNCTSLTSIELPDNIVSIGSNVFDGCSAEVVCNANTQTATTLANAGYTFTSVVPVVASGSCGDNVTWQLDGEGVLTISGSGEMEAYWWDESCAPWYSRRESIDSVVIEDGVTNIGGLAFYNCINLESIVIPDSVTSIGGWAFYECSSLKDIEIPDSVTSMAEEVFVGCSSLERITIPEGVTSIGNLAFCNCTSLKSITIPNSVTSIVDEAFYGCSSLTRIELPDNITSIGSGVLNGCPAELVCRAGSRTAETLANAGYIFKLEGAAVVASGSCGDNVTWQLDGEGLLTISGSGAMEDYEEHYSVWNGRYESIKSAVIEEGVTSIGDWAFTNCSGLESIAIADSVTRIGDYAFADCSTLESIDLPDGVTSIGAGAFYDCSSLESIDLPDGVTSIGDYAFYHCTNLASITIPEGVTSIGECAFDNCVSLERITLPQGVTSIGRSAFYNCSSLESITIPDSVTSIGDWAFYNCTSLRNVTIPEGVTSVGACAFYCCDNLESVTIPDSVTSIGSNAFSGGCDICYCSKDSYAAIALTNEGRSFIDPQYPLLTLEAYEAGNGERTFTVVDCDNAAVSVEFPQGVTSIGNSAFAICKNLKSVTIPQGVTSIGDHAFTNCSALENIVIPDSVTSIGYAAFGWCTSLESITIPEGVTSIGERAFYSSGVTSIAILNAGDMTFGSNVFSNSVTVYCYKYSAADFWAEENEYPVIYLDELGENQPQTITLPEDFSLRKGESCTIAAAIFPAIPNVQISWSSSAPEIAAVENGCVTALRAGEAIITAACGDVSDTVRVTVNVPLESFDLPADELWMISKETMQLNIQNVQPEDGTEPVTWSSSNTSVLTVSQSGLLTGKMPGNAVVTATAPNGFSRSATVHVCYPVTAVAFEQESHDVVIGGQIQLSANVTARTQSFVNKLVTFASSDETIAAVDENGLVTAMGYGTAEITAAASSGVQAACTVRVVCGAHQETVTPAVEPTCAETGLTEGRHCAVCNMVLVEQEVVPMTGHRIAFEQAVYETELGAQTGEAVLVAQCGHDVAIRAQVSGEAELVSADNLRVQYRGKACGVAEITVQTDDEFAVSAVCKVIVHAKDKMELPEALRIIGEEAFMGMPAKEIVLGDHVETIASKAFASCANLRLISLPDTVASIAADAFSGCRDLTIICGEGSAAQRFAQDHGMAYVTR